MSRKGNRGAHARPGLKAQLEQALHAKHSALTLVTAILAECGGRVKVSPERVKRPIAREITYTRTDDGGMEIHFAAPEKGDSHE